MGKFPDKIGVIDLKTIERGHGFVITGYISPEIVKEIVFLLELFTEFFHADVMDTAVRFLCGGFFQICRSVFQLWNIIFGRIFGPVRRCGWY